MKVTELRQEAVLRKPGSYVARPGSSSVRRIWLRSLAAMALSVMSRSYSLPVRLSRMVRESLLPPEGAWVSVTGAPGDGESSACKRTGDAPGVRPTYSPGAGQETRAREGSGPPGAVRTRRFDPPSRSQVVLTVAAAPGHVPDADQDAPAWPARGS